MICCLFNDEATSNIVHALTVTVVSVRLIYGCIVQMIETNDTIQLNCIILSITSTGICCCIVCSSSFGS